MMIFFSLIKEAFKFDYAAFFFEDSLFFFAKVKSTFEIYFLVLEKIKTTSMKKIFASLFILMLLHVFTFGQKNDSTSQISYPYFPDCDVTNLDATELLECSKEKLLDFLKENISYPAGACQPLNIIKVDFRIGKNGTVKTSTIGTYPREGCENQVSKVLRKIPKWEVDNSMENLSSIEFSLEITFFRDSTFTIHFQSEEVDELDEELQELEVKEEPEEEKIFKVVKHIPRFPGCEGKGMGKDELQKCSEDEMLKFLYSNIKYPRLARKRGTEGKVVVQFVVEKDGSVQNIKIVRDIGSGCGKEVMRIIEMMNHMGLKWITPSRGKPIKFPVTVPVSFKLAKPPKEKN